MGAVTGFPEEDKWGRISKLVALDTAQCGDHEVRYIFIQITNKVVICYLLVIGDKISLRHCIGRGRGTNRWPGPSIADLEFFLHI